MLSELERRGVESLGSLANSISQMVISLPATITLLIFVITSLMTLSFLMLMSWSSIKPQALRKKIQRHL